MRLPGMLPEGVAPHPRQWFESSHQRMLSRQLVQMWVAVVRWSIGRQIWPAYLMKLRGQSIVNFELRCPAMVSPTHKKLRAKELVDFANQVGGASRTSIIVE